MLVLQATASARRFTRNSPYIVSVLEALCREMLGVSYKGGLMDLEERLDLACRGTVEVIQRSELKKLLAEKKKPRAYWGFECSGKRALARLE